MKNFKWTKGFTLIELLIVIALLGALAVGLIGAIDPFEQLKKGTDTGTRDLVSQVQTAIIRYYAVKSALPWAKADDPKGTDLTVAPMPVALDAIAASGELRSDFKTVQAGKLSLIFVWADSATGFVAVCYAPTSKSFNADPNTKYDVTGQVNTGTGTAACKSVKGADGVQGTTQCYWCIE